ncbi:MAG: hypothetical protein GY866_04830 [Proteobacteria bacterium]|nr:hypothetical protein [Pseudomonadota bacterium]
MLACPNCRRNGAKILERIDTGNFVVECNQHGCYSRYLVNASYSCEIKPQRKAVGAFPPAGKFRPGRPQLKILPCPNPHCGSENVRQIKSCPENDQKANLKHFECRTCGQTFQIWIQFVEWIVRGIGFLNIRDPKKFIELLSPEIREQFVSLSINGKTAAAK